jgi:hypothetical protein
MQGYFAYYNAKSNYIGHQYRNTAIFLAYGLSLHWLKSQDGSLDFPKTCGSSGIAVVDTRIWGVPMTQTCQEHRPVSGWYNPNRV